MPEAQGSLCLKCGRDGPAWALRGCPICGRTVCTKCATLAYGRFFCSARCADYFFHAEPEDDEAEQS